MSRSTITAVHIFDCAKVDSVMRKMRPALAMSEELWVSSSSPTLSSLVCHIEKKFHPRVRGFAVPNTWHDWSGFLSFIQHMPSGAGLIIANDSIATRRVLSAHSIKAVVNAFRGQDHALVGELDVSSESVLIGQQASACWVSTYLFGLAGVEIDIGRLEADVRDDVREIMRNPQHVFLRYLMARRPGILRQPDLLGGKLGAMCFERRLTLIATNQGSKIVHSFAGSWVRKIERAMERGRDA